MGAEEEGKGTYSLTPRGGEHGGTFAILRGFKGWEFRRGLRGGAQ